MAEQTPQNINPATDPQVEDPPATTVPLADIDTAPDEISAATDPQVPQSTGGTELVTAPPPDEAFLEQQTAQENRWIQAAATNPEGIQDNGSVKIAQADGTVETINRDGSYSISGADGTTYYDAAGQQTAYQTPTINGLSVTTTSDGIQYTNYSVGPLTTSTITKDGELISTDTSYTIGETTLRQTEVAGGEVVNSASTIVPSDDPNAAGTLTTFTQVGEGDIVTTETALLTKQQTAEAANTANAENIKLREDLIAAKQQIDSGTPLSDTQLAALEEQAQITEAADQVLFDAQQSVAEQDFTVVAAGTDPQVVEPADTNPVPALDTIAAEPEPVNTAFRVSTPQGTLEFPDEQTYRAYQEDPQSVAFATGPGGVQYVTEVEPVPQQEQLIDPVDDPEVQSFEQAQIDNEAVPESEIEIQPAEITAEDDPEIAEFEATQITEVPGDEIESDPTVVTDADPQIPQDETDQLPEALVYEDPEPPTEDPVVLAQADDVVTDVPVSDLETEPQVIDSDFDPQVSEVESAVPQGGFYGEPGPVGGNFTAAYNPETGTYDVIDLDTGDIVDSGLSQQQATLIAEDFSLGDPQFPNETQEFTAESDIVREPTAVDVGETFVQQDDGLFVLNQETQPQPDEFGFVETEGGLFVQQDEIEAEIDQQQFEDDLGAEQVSFSDIQRDPAAVADDPQNPDKGTPFDDDGNLNPGWTRDGNGDPVFIGDNFIDPDLRDSATQQREQAQAANRLNATINARRQAEFQRQIKEANDGDWRVRLRLAPGANYLYRDPSGPGILAPLAKTDGVLFPYTPQITTAYKADYESYALTHSNYRGYFYKGSYVDDIQINAMFTAQDSVEAEYLLAVIHFFRSATKMFYGQDPQAGAPPPVVYLQGHGVYQFNLAPCVIAQFNYNLPTDVDYIRARSPNINATNLLQRRQRSAVPSDPFTSAFSRIKNLLNPQGIRAGAQQFPPAAPTLGTNQPTYVPTKMEISLILHPIQSRQDVSKLFSLKNFANGNQLRGGFW